MGVGYAAAAAEVEHLKPKVCKPLVCLLQCVVGVGCKELHRCGQGRRGGGGGGGGVGAGQGAAWLGEVLHHSSQLSLKWDQ